MNLVEYLARATEYLERHDVSSPRLNSEILLCHLLDIRRIDIYTGFERALTPGQADEYKRLLARRASGFPLQYLTGETGFRNLTLHIVEGVFIPRPETELVVEKALEVMPEGARVLDIGSGCGNIAVSIASEREDATVTAVDVDRAAVELTGGNAETAGVEGRVEVIQSDLFAALVGRRYDIIISNPPYVPEAARDSLPSEVRDFEPPAALFAGPDGLDTIARILADAPCYLNDGGWLVLEIDETQDKSVAAMLKEQGWVDVQVMEDLTGRPRIARARRADER